MRPCDPFPGISVAPVPWTCAECGAGLLLPPGRAQRRTFCSRSCMGSFQRRAMQAGERARPPGPQTVEGAARSRANLLLGPSVTAAQFAEALPVWRTCPVCGEEYPSKANPAPTYCSERCRQHALRASGRYQEERSCVLCQRPFRASRYAPTRTCSRSCARRLWWREKKEAACPSV